MTYEAPILTTAPEVDSNPEEHPRTPAKTFVDPIPVKRPLEKYQEFVKRFQTLKERDRSHLFALGFGIAILGFLTVGLYCWERWKAIPVKTKTNGKSKPRERKSTPRSAGERYAGSGRLRGEASPVSHRR